ncbi:MAG TPA: TlpA disulfide reductase family protein [Pyrinomonadaceae bacterium]|nr:TlpA disulfide reductase family protein [Pyrinomonadaceae bacterium]
MISKLNRLICIVTFAAFGLIIGGCGDSSVSDKPANNAASNTKPAVADSSQYPLLNSAIANAPLEQLDGTKIKAADRKGNILLLNLWATWCGPCRSEMPHLVELHSKYRDAGFQVLGLDVGDGNGNPESVEDIKKFAAKMRLNYELFRISNETVGEFYKLNKFEGVPQTILIDRQGRLRGVFLGGGEKVINTMKQTVDKVIAESPTPGA